MLLLVLCSPQAISLALPYVVLVMVCGHQLGEVIRGEAQKKRPQATQRVYVPRPTLSFVDIFCGVWWGLCPSFLRVFSFVLQPLRGALDEGHLLPFAALAKPQEKYFGLRGVHYPIKVSLLQAVTVLVQAFGKISLLSALVTFSQTKEHAPTAWLSFGFWCFFALLCFNSTYPPILMIFPDSAWARIGAALMDAILDLGYILTYLGMVLWQKLREFGRHFIMIHTIIYDF